MSIQAQPVTYNNIRFRSRLEARWAILFDRLHVPYQYEPRGFPLETGWYLPDFYLPRQHWWVEIKGQAPTDQEIQKAGLLAATTNEGVLLFAGKIGVLTPGYICLSRDPNQDVTNHASDVIIADEYVVIPHNYWCRCPKCNDLAIYFRRAYQVLCQQCVEPGAASDVLFEDSLLRDAFVYARDAELWKSWYR